jgi:hypothetical protein
MAVGAHHVSQGVRVAGVALGAGHAVALPVAGHLQRVDRVDLVAGRDQRLHPAAAVGLDADHHRRRLVVIAHVLADHRVQPGDARDTLRQFRCAQHPARLVLQLDVVVFLGPVIANEQQFHVPIHHGHHVCGGLRENYQRPNEQVLTPESAGTTSHQRSGLPTTSRGTILT